MTFETTRLLLRPWCESDAESCSKATLRSPAPSGVRPVQYS